MKGRPLLLFVPLCIASCRSTDLGWQASEPPWGEMATSEIERARAATDAVRYEEAWAILAPLSQAQPSDLELATWLQDLRLELLASGSRVDAALEPWHASGEPAEALRKLYAERAVESESPVTLVLAARVESDAISAIALLDRALALDPALAWAHYGKAHALLRHRTLVERWSLAGESLARALALDPGLIGARRLEAWMLAQEGSVGEARAALETWLVRTRSDVRVGARERATAEVDLALLRVLDGDTEGARELLEGLEGVAEERDRRLTVLTVAAAEMGDLQAALEAARQAGAAAPDDVLPLVQQALLQQYWRGDEEAARELWNEVIARAATAPDIGTLLQGMRAQLQVEREQARAAENAAESGQ